MSDFQFNENVVFVFYTDLAGSIGRRVETECAENLAHGYAHGRGLEHEFKQDNCCDIRLNVVVPPTEADAFQEFMDDVGVEPSYTACIDERDAYHAQKCGWNGKLLSKCG